MENLISDPWITNDWKLVIACAPPRLVHARGCDYIKNWKLENTEIVSKLKPQKQWICKACEGLAYVTVGAKDYVKNLYKYKILFKDVSPKVLKTFFLKNKGKTEIVGEKLYIQTRTDNWYIDFSFDDIRLFHNNYQVSKRERTSSPCYAAGYHEHTVYRPGNRLQNALEAIIGYDYSEAEKRHIRKRKKVSKMTLSEYDPEAYGF